MNSSEGDRGEAWQRPEISVRLDPFLGVLEARLGVAVATGLSVELVPVALDERSESPRTLNLVGRMTTFTVRQWARPVTRSV